jgi:hypothetical protein
MEAGGRNAVARHEGFRERLARFEARGGGRWPKQQPAGAGECVGDAEAQRELRADDSEVDLFVVGQREQGGRVRQVARDDARQLRNAWIAGGTHELADVAVARQPRDERMLAGAGTDHENSHG